MCHRNFKCIILIWDSQLCTLILIEALDEYLSLSAEWRILREHFNSLCNTLPYNYQLTIDKLRNMVQITKPEGQQLSKLITSSSSDVKNINKKIITYLIIKLCYTHNSGSLVKLCDVMDELIDPTGKPTCVQQIRCGNYTYLLVLLFTYTTKYNSSYVHVHLSFLISHTKSKPLLIGSVLQGQVCPFTWAQLCTKVCHKLAVKCIPQYHFFAAKIIRVYLFCGILFLSLSISTKIFEHEIFSVWLMKRCTRKCTIRLTIIFQGYHFYYYLVGQCKQSTTVLKRNG